MITTAGSHKPYLSLRLNAVCCVVTGNPIPDVQVSEFAVGETPVLVSRDK